jgi:hypothetical protein
MSAKYIYWNKNKYLMFYSLRVPEDIPGGKARPALRADNITAIRVPTV